MKEESLKMHQPINQVRLGGFLTESARLFVSRSGQPRLTFRLEVWIDDQSLPPKKPAGVDYFSVVAFGTQFVGLASELVRGREVTVSGRLRSRDLETVAQQVVTEVVAQEIVVLETRTQALHDRSLQMIVN
jgi:single-stranded DNA-binding protein